MANKTTSFKKKGKGKERGTSNKNSKQVAAPMKKPKARPKPGTECFYCKGNGHWKWNYLRKSWIRGSSGVRTLVRGPD